MATVEDVNYFLSGEWCDCLIDLHYINSEGDDSFIRLTTDDILQDSLTIDRYSTNTDRVDIGGAYASELTFKIKDIPGDYDFIGNDCKVYAAKDRRTIVSALGYFIVTDIEYGTSYLTVKALDRMITLEKPVDWTLLLNKYSYYKSLQDDPYIIGMYGYTPAMIQAIADVNDFNVEISASTCKCANNKFDNYSAMSDLDITYRELLQNIAFLNGGIAYVESNNELRLSWYTEQIYNDGHLTFELTDDDRYSSKLSRNDITITGIKYTDEDGNELKSGTDEYTLSYAGCKIMNYVPNKQTALDNLVSVVGGFTYRPYEAVMHRLPYIIPTTVFNFVDHRSGNTYPTIVTHFNFKLNGSTKISAVGKPAIINEYTLINKLTGATQQAMTELSNETKQALRKAMEWTLIKQTMAAETIEGLEDAGYTEFLLACQLDPTSGSGYQHERFLASIVIPAENFFGYTGDHGNGAHQAYYSSTYNSGVSYLGNNQVKLYHTSGCYSRLYAR